MREKSLDVHSQLEPRRNIPDQMQLECNREMILLRHQSEALVLSTKVNYLLPYPKVPMYLPTLVSILERSKR